VDRDEVAATQRRQAMLAEVIGRFADWAVDPRRLGRVPRFRGDRSPEGRQGRDLVPRFVEGGPNELGHPDVEHDLAAVPLSDVEHAADEVPGPRHEDTTGLDRESSRPPIHRDLGEQVRKLSREPLDGWGRPVVRPDREPAAHVERVEVAARARDEREQGQCPADAVAPGIDRTQLRADMEMNAAGHEAS